MIVFGMFVFVWVRVLIKFVVVVWMFLVVELSCDINSFIFFVDVCDWFLFGMMRDRITI